uniref:Uncharacterized protein n=1 Tax=Arundo donax TaxID=35708 RepID=A0A0A9EQL9_ARUDO
MPFLTLHFCDKICLMLMFQESGVGGKNCQSHTRPERSA